GKLEPRDTYPAVIPSNDNAQTGFRTGVCFDAARGNLFSLTVISKGGNKSLAWGDATTDRGAGGTISRFVVGTNGTRSVPTTELSMPCGKRPYDVVKGATGLLYVSDWADRCVLT